MEKLIISPKILQSSKDTMDKIKEEYGLSQAKLIDLLMTSIKTGTIQVSSILNKSTVQVPETSTSTITSIVQAEMQVHIQALAQVQAQVTSMQETIKQLTSTSTSTITSTKEPYSSGIDWDAIVEEPYEPDAHKFEYVTTTDHEGNEQTIRVMKSEYMFNLAPDPNTKEEPEIDPDDPLEKAIREQEEEWNKKWGE